MLHIAPEQPFLGRFRKMKHLDLTTADLFSPLADVRCNIQSLPFPDNSFDVIFCNHVLEHVEDDAKAMRELYRVLRSGGFGIFQVPVDYSRHTTYEDASIVSENDRELHFWQKDHVRLYGLDYLKKLENSGFIAQRIDMTETLDQTSCDRYRLGSADNVYRCDKPRQEA